jgi:hypothetical protein
MNIYFKNHEITIRRFKRKGITNRYTLSATFTVYPIDIQPATATRQQLENGKFGATHTAFIDSSVDIQENDEVVTETGQKYTVKGVQHWEDAGMLDHKELYLTSNNA